MVYVNSSSYKCEADSFVQKTFICPDGQEVMIGCEGYKGLVLFTCVTSYSPQCDVISVDSDSSTDCTTTSFNTSHIICACQTRSNATASQVTSPHKVGVTIGVNRQYTTTHTHSFVKHDTELVPVTAFVGLLYGFFFMLSSGLLFYNQRSKQLSIKPWKKDLKGGGEGNGGGGKEEELKGENFGEFGDEQKQTTTSIHKHEELDEYELYNKYMKENYIYKIFQGVYSDQPLSNRIRSELFRSSSVLKSLNLLASDAKFLGAV